MDQQPKIPTLKDAQKPQVKIKGMGAGLTLFDRLKQFKKKDLAFILAGLGTLFMAPLAEHFMMAPENGDASLQQGWGKGGPSGSFFGSGSSPYETGGMAPGGAIGGSGDIITPLNVRDPSSLVMGPGGMQQPPAGSAAPAAPPPTAPSRSDEDYKDALKGAASRAASAAVKKAPLPIPKVALGGSGLRGLGVASGGSSASGGSMPVGPAAGSVGGGGNSGLRLVRNTPGFKGVAGSRSPTGGTGLDNTKKAGANAGDAFNRAGSAAAGLNAAANEQIPTGGSGFGGGGQGGAGANDKPGSGTGPGGSKSVGESLAFLRAKQRQEEELKLEFEKRKLKDPELLLYGIRNDVLKASAGKLGEGLTTWGMCKGLGMGCPAPDSELMCGGIGTSAAKLSMCGTVKPGESAGKCFKPNGDGTYSEYLNGGQGNETGTKCYPTGKPGDGKKDPSTEAPATDGQPRVAPMPSSAGLSTVCGKIPAKVSAPAATPAAAGTAVAVVDDRQAKLATFYTETLGPKAKNTEYAQNQLVRGGSTACGSTPPEKTVSELLSEAKANLIAAGGEAAAKDAASLIIFGADKVEIAEADKARAARDAAVAKIAKAKAQIVSANTALGQTYTAVRPPRGIDVSAEGDVDTAVGQVDAAQGETKTLIGTLNSNIERLEAGITSFEPLVGKTAPAGALSDQINLNKALAGLTTAAEKKTKYEPEIDKATSGAVEAQPTARQSVEDLKGAVNKAYETAEAAKIATGDAKKKADDDAAAALKLVEPAVTKANTDVQASQKALKDKTAEVVTPINTIAIGSASAAPVAAK
ncbi:MAG: hypothetical protein Q8T11_06935 [Elusimicrobiota bacterium]|nr:hypothetical protein [Elusimicrobiota bacterium]